MQRCADFRRLHFASESGRKRATTKIKFENKNECLQHNGLCDFDWIVFWTAHKILCISPFVCGIYGLTTRKTFRMLLTILFDVLFMSGDIAVKRGKFPISLRNDV